MLGAFYEIQSQCDQSGHITSDSQLANAGTRPVSVPVLLFPHSCSCTYSNGKVYIMMNVCRRFQEDCAEKETNSLVNTLQVREHISN